MIKRDNPTSASRKGEKGGNRKKQTFKICDCCGKEFGPVDHLVRRFCSYACKVKAQTTGRKVFRRTIAKARAAQSLVRHHILAGHIIRPEKCEECGKHGRIEAAHYDYDKPLEVRWLCRSCHVKWDKAEPKHATVICQFPIVEGNKPFYAEETIIAVPVARLQQDIGAQQQILH